MLMEIFKIMHTAWFFAEPFVGVLSVLVLALVWSRERITKMIIKKTRRFKREVVVVVETAQPILADVKSHFMEIDKVIMVEDIINKNLVETAAEAKKVVGKIFEVLMEYKTSKIHLVLTGSPAVNFLLGQLVGMGNFDLCIYQYTQATGYIPMANVEVSWKRPHKKLHVA